MGGATQRTVPGPAKQDAPSAGAAPPEPDPAAPQMISGRVVPPDVSGGRGPAMSAMMKDYFDRLHTAVEACYAVAKEARAKGLDPELDVEILPAEDLAARVEAQVGVAGVAEDIRKVTKEIGNRELVSLEVARRVAAGRYGAFTTAEEAVDKAVRTGLSILTEGVLVAPLEGIAEVKIGHNSDGTNYVDVYFAGPIRAAGGTAQAMSVLIADVVRREHNIGAYVPTDAELERYKEEVPAYKRAANLQYTPGPTEIEAIVKNCPVCINGEGTERVEIAGNRDLPRVETNQIRGGAMLVLCEGMCLKAPKLQKHVNKLGLEGWEFLDLLVNKKKDDDKDQPEEEVDPDALPVIAPSTKFIRDIIAGRPVFGHPSRAGGFRLRYGRGRTAGLAASAVHPAVMPLVDDFIAIGTQLKIERPGKGTIGSPCSTIDPPTALLRSGDLIRLDTTKTVQAAKPFVTEILDLGELLMPFGEFCENNHILARSPWVNEWFEAEVETYLEGHEWPSELPRPAALLRKDRQETLDARTAYQVAEVTGLPLAPSHTAFWHDLSVDEIRLLSDRLAARLDEHSFGPAAPLREMDGCPEDRPERDTLFIPADDEIKQLLVKLTFHHRNLGDRYEATRHGYTLMRSLGFDQHENGKVFETERRSLLSELDPTTLDRDYPTVDLVSRLSGVTQRPRAPFRIGARMGRPEKADARKMKPPPHVLFPLGTAGGSQRLVGDAAKSRQIKVEVGKRRCVNCRGETYRTFCDECGGHTEVASDEPEEATLDLSGELRRAQDNLGGVRIPKQIKGVVGMMSKHKTPEPLEKGILRATHGVYTFKDGTVRFDMSDGPLTHFRPAEIAVSPERLVELGYTHDTAGRPLERDDQVLELRVQDIVVPNACGDYLLACAKYVDDLMVRFYGMEPYYNATTRADLVGHMAGGLAPHTSAAVAVRIIGFTPSQVGWGHPYFHAGKRRNCLTGETELYVLERDNPKRVSLEGLWASATAPLEKLDDTGTTSRALDAKDVYAVDPTTGRVRVQRATRVLRTPAPRHGLLIRTESGRHIRASPGHRLVSWLDGDLQKVEARSLRPGSVLLAAAKLPLIAERGQVARQTSGAGTSLLQLVEPELMQDIVASVEHVALDVEWLYDLEVEEDHTYLLADLLATSNCDGDEDAVFLLMDGLLNFSRSYVPDRRGGLMDLPLVLTTRLDPSEIDKEAHNVDTLERYPLAFFEATTRHEHPKEVESIMGMVTERLGTPLQYEGFGYSHDTPDISEGILMSSYKTIPDMMAKLVAQLDLANKIRAVDMKDVASRVIGSHFMPDLIGNLKAFSKQKVRCPACNTKYRRFPLAGRCLTEACKGKLTLTVHEGSVRKYLQPAIDISRKYDVSHYTLQRILLAQKSIESLFNNDKVRKAKLDDFFADDKEEP